MFDSVDFTDLDFVRAANKKQQDGQIAADYVVMMSRCKDHYFHLDCLKAQLGIKDYLECSTCMVMYGRKTGDQPPGTMTWVKESFACDGYPGDMKTWVINYEFPSGIHPETKKPFHGDGRVGYLPDNEEGVEVLALLVESFRRKLTFTVGFSVVRGQDNCIVWNGVHHKTRTHGGSTRYGYPDPTYCNRVKQELALKGVVFESDQHKQELIKEVTTQLNEVMHGQTNKSKNKKIDFSRLTGFKIPGF